MMRKTIFFAMICILYFTSVCSSFGSNLRKPFIKIVTNPSFSLNGVIGLKSTNILEKTAKPTFKPTLKPTTKQTTNPSTKTTSKPTTKPTITSTLTVTGVVTVKLSTDVPTQSPTVNITREEMEEPSEVNFYCSYYCALSLRTTYSINALLNLHSFCSLVQIVHPAFHNYWSSQTGTTTIVFIIICALSALALSYKFYFSTLCYKERSRVALSELSEL